jgi:hypothetical protein
LLRNYPWHEKNPSFFSILTINVSCLRNASLYCFPFLLFSGHVFSFWHTNTPNQSFEDGLQDILRLRKSDDGTYSRNALFEKLSDKVSNDDGSRSAPLLQNT